MLGKMRKNGIRCRNREGVELLSLVCVCVFKDCVKSDMYTHNIIPFFKHGFIFMIKAKLRFYLFQIQFFDNPN